MSPLRHACRLLLLVAALPAAAATLWTGGDLSLTYDQLLGPLDGAFAASGVLWPAGPEGQPAESGAGGFAGVAEGRWLVAAVGVAAGAAPGTVDAALVFLQGDGTELPGPGVWTVTPGGGDAAFVLVLGASAADVPAEITPEALADLLASIEADHVLVGVTGAVALERRDDAGLAGAFSGSMVDRDDPLTVVSVDDGVFDLGDPVTGNRTLSTGELKRGYR